MVNLKTYTILHIFSDPKFSQGFFDFLKKQGESLEGHFLFHIRYNRNNGLDHGMPAIFSPGFFSIWPGLRLLIPLFRAQKILIHGLSSPFLVLYLCLFPGLGKKCYWVIWGKDLYFYRTLEKKQFYHRIFEFFRKIAIRRIGQVITFNNGDYQLARQWYGCEAKQFRSFMYPSNLFHDYPSADGHSGKLTIFLGNSADSSNNHLEAFDILAEHVDSEFELLVPLSYGNIKYTKIVLEKGRQLFGSRFTPLTDFIPFEQYLDLLNRVDIAIFAHRRQQAMGNITTLLGMKKKVYIRSDISTWDLLQELGITVFDLSKFDLDKIHQEVAEKNRELVKQVFSEKNLLKQWQEIVSHQAE